MNGNARPDISVEMGNDFAEIRDEVRKLCADFPGEYWRELEDKPPSQSYPTEFIEALTSAGYLAALIPEEYGGAHLVYLSRYLDPADPLYQMSTEELWEAYLPGLQVGVLHQGHKGDVGVAYVKPVYTGKGSLQDEHQAQGRQIARRLEP